MAISLETMLKAMKTIGAIAAKTNEVAEILSIVKMTFGKEDMQVINAAYHDLIKDNEEGYKRLDEKLAAASKV